MELKIKSEKYGDKIALIDEEDYYRMINDFGNATWYLLKNPRNNDFYAERKVKGKNISMHRYIMKFPKGMYVDHLNHNTLDNRKSNLRVTTNVINCRNRRISKNNTSGISGVHFYKKYNKYMAYIKVNYKRIFLGYFSDYEDAVKARKNAEILYWAVKER